MKALEELTRSKTAFDKKFEADGKTTLEAGFAEFFTANPGIEAVRWIQFSEGCEVDDPFDGVGDPTFKLTEEPESAASSDDDDDEEEEENEDAEGADGFLRVEMIVDPALRRSCKRLAAEIDGHDELFFALFDSGSQVTWTRGGVEVEDLEEAE